MLLGGFRGGSMSGYGGLVGFAGGVIRCTLWFVNHLADRKYDKPASLNTYAMDGSQLQAVLKGQNLAPHQQN